MRESKFGRHDASPQVASFCVLFGVVCLGLAGAQTLAQSPETQHVLFVGDSYTHGRYLPVRNYNATPLTGGVGSTAASVLVVDENYKATAATRAENTAKETGPWGGIPGIFAELAAEAGLPTTYTSKRFRGRRLRITLKRHGA